MSSNVYMVYKHTSPSGKSYIGITKNYAKRCHQHRHNRHCPAFHAAIKKYGWEHFEHEVLAENVTQNEALLLEEHYIQEHNTQIPFGYNITSGGRGAPSRTISDLERERRRQSALLKPPMTESTRQKMIEINGQKRGVPRSDEVRDKIRMSKLGHVVSDETRLKLAKTYTFISPDGAIITFTNMSEFCRQHSLHVGVMCEVANGKRKSHKGWKTVNSVTSQRGR